MPNQAIENDIEFLTDQFCENSEQLAVLVSF